MKRILVFIAGCLLQAGVGAEELKAVLHRTDGRAWQVFLVSADEGQLTMRLEKGTVNTTILFSDIDRLDIEHAPVDMEQAEQLFNEAKYAQVVDQLESVAAPAGAYMAASNNLQDAYLLLAKAYYEGGKIEKAAMAAVQMIRSESSSLSLYGNVLAALCAVSVGEFETAAVLCEKIPNPAALYVRAEAERARGGTKRAFRTAVKIIEDHPNDMAWLPRAELLCARLYMDLGELSSADAAARQVQVFYAGMNVADEASGLREQIKMMNAEKEPKGIAQ